MRSRSKGSIGCRYVNWWARHGPPPGGLPGLPPACLAPKSNSWFETGFQHSAACTERPRSDFCNPTSRPDTPTGARHPRLPPEHTVVVLLGNVSSRTTCQVRRDGNPDILTVTSTRPRRSDTASRTKGKECATSRGDWRGCRPEVFVRRQSTTRSGE